MFRLRIHFDSKWRFSDQTGSFFYQLTKIWDACCFHLQWELKYKVFQILYRKFTQLAIGKTWLKVLTWNWNIWHQNVSLTIWLPILSNWQINNSTLNLNLKNLTCSIHWAILFIVWLFPKDFHLILNVIQPYQVFNLFYFQEKS